MRESSLRKVALLSAAAAFHLIPTLSTDRASEVKQELNGMDGGGR